MSTGRHRGKFLNAAAVISVEDVARTIAFYEEELGLELEHEMWGDPPEHASVTVGATAVHFERRQPTKPATAYVTLYVKGVDDGNVVMFAELGEAHERLVAGG